jgi:1-acyl-sn-glycerol-3-phosphate acyltransferase
VDIFRLLYSIYALTAFFILLPAMVLIYIIVKICASEKNQIWWVHKLNRLLFIIWSAFVGFRYKISGTENIDQHQAYIVICNHNNIADIPASAYAIQVAAKPLVKKELLKIPLLGQLFAMASVPVDRGSEEGRKKSVGIMRDQLNKGVSLIIFPEGTRNRTDQPLKEFYDGAFSLSIETGIPILPVVFTNIRGISKPTSLLIRPWVIEATHLPPVYPDNFDKSRVKEYKQLLFTTMWNFLTENDEMFKDVAKR